MFDWIKQTLFRPEILFLLASVFVLAVLVGGVFMTASEKGPKINIIRR